MSGKVQFTTSEQLNLPAQFVDYNKQPIVILGAMKINKGSAGWEILNATFLITKIWTRCILGLDLQNKVGISTTQKTAPKEKFRFDVLSCELSE